MSQTRWKRAKTNLKHKFSLSPLPQVNLSLYLYWLANVASMLLAGGAVTQLEKREEKSLNGGGEVVEHPPDV